MNIKPILLLFVCAIAQQTSAMWQPRPAPSLPSFNIYSKGKGDVNELYERTARLKQRQNQLAEISYNLRGCECVRIAAAHLPPFDFLNNCFVAFITNITINDSRCIQDTSFHALFSHVIKELVDLHAMQRKPQPVRKQSLHISVQSKLQVSNLFEQFGFKKIDDTWYMLTAPKTLAPNEPLTNLCNKYKLSNISAGYETLPVAQQEVNNAPQP